MSIEIKIIESASQWREAELLFKPHTFLQSWEWSLSQEALGQKIFHLGIFNNNELIGLAFIYLIKARRGSFLFCPHGPIINWDTASEIMPTLVTYLIKLGREQKADFIRLSPLAPKTPRNENLFSQLGFRPAPIHMMHPELAWMIDLSPATEELLKNMEKRTRYSIRKAEKDGVEIKSGVSVNDLDKFYKLYEQTAERQKFVPFTKAYLKKELESFVKSNKITIYFAYYKNEPIATAMVVFAGNSAFYHHGASVRKFSNITASELIQWKALNDAKNRGLKFYNFWGIAPENSPNHPWEGLTKFKKGFGGFSEEYLHAQDLPITCKYWVNYIVETTRKTKRGY